MYEKVFASEPIGFLYGSENRLCSRDCIQEHNRVGIRLCHIHRAAGQFIRVRLQPLFEHNSRGCIDSGLQRLRRNDNAALFRGIRLQLLHEACLVGKVFARESNGLQGSANRFCSRDRIQENNRVGMRLCPIHRTPG